MSISTKGVVATRNKSVFFIAELVSAALHSAIRQASQEGLNPGQSATALSSNAVELEVNPRSKYLRAHFTHNGARQTMYVFFATDVERTNISPSSISLNMNRSADSERYVRAVLAALRVLGPTYFQAQDSGGHPFEVLELPALSYLEACRAGLVDIGKSSLQDWANEFKTGTLAASTEQDVFGMSMADVTEILRLSYPKAEARLMKVI